MNRPSFNDDERLDQAMATWMALPVPECPAIELPARVAPPVPRTRRVRVLTAVLAVFAILVTGLVLRRWGPEKQEPIVEQIDNPHEKGEIAETVRPTPPPDIALVEQSAPPPGLIHRSEIRQGEFESSSLPSPPLELARLQSELRDLGERLRTGELRDRTEELAGQLQRMVTATP